MLLVTLGGCSSTPVFDDRPSGIDKYLEGVREENVGDRGAAIDSFNQALRLNPSLRMARIKLADLYRGGGDYGNAASQYEVAAKLDPYSASTAYSLGLCYQFLHRLADAAAQYLRVLDLQPTHYQASMNLGLVYLELGHAGDAERYLHRATQLDPKSAAAWSNYGVGLDALGRLSEAEAAYRQSLELDAGSISTLENLAANLIAQRKASESREVCQQLLLRSDNAMSRTRYGQSLVLSGQEKEAFEQYQLALQRNPHFYLAMTAEGFLLINQYQSGMELDEPKREAALGLFDASLKFNANQPSVQAGGSAVAVSAADGQVIFQSDETPVKPGLTKQLNNFGMERGIDRSQRFIARIVPGRLDPRDRQARRACSHSRARRKRDRA